MTTPLRGNRDFRLLWLSGLFAVLGGQMSSLALPLLVLKETGSAVQAGAVGTVSVGAVLITMLPGGVMADRVERRRLMRVCDVGSLIVVTALTVAVWSGHVPMALVLLCAAAGAVIGSVYGPAVFGLMRAVVPADQMGTATARLQARTQTARLVGPLVGERCSASTRPCRSRPRRWACSCRRSAWPSYAPAPGPGRRRAPCSAGASSWRG